MCCSAGGVELILGFCHSKSRSQIPGPEMEYTTLAILLLDSGLWSLDLTF